MEFFNVTTVKNIGTVKSAIDKHKEIHEFSTYTIICPMIDCREFELQFANEKKVKIVNEDDIISLARFKKLADEATNEYSGKNINKQRINWYYQQILKLTYALQSEELRTVMWDADTVPISKINFFEGNVSKVYGSRIEYHWDYFETLRHMFHFNDPKYALTIQFFSLTLDEKMFLKRLLGEYRKKADMKPMLSG